ncbi:uncharacterized protein LOC106166423 [Lingula anatina]|uniref:Uncharacterized protein LOC106166423 n=1 Tax=Lingula anatina TaxID=7574 RepID=A0A1S3IQD6_LINAN|nr:uncharacterized protein LOC106166423 [Lingula anatina]|eukprot:XP_013400435.1 uncharacterized protein LOC106166423 [Lingula anatina]
MMLAITVLMFLLGRIELGEALECTQCMYITDTGGDEYAQGVIQKMYASVMDAGCAKNPTSVTKTISCDGSCAYAEVNTTTQIDGNSTSVGVVYRSCNPSKSVNEGCKTLSSNDVQNLQAVLGGGLTIGQKVSGRMCFCNSDSCTQDASSLPALPKAPHTQCHVCTYMKYETSDSQMQKTFDQITQATSVRECLDKGSETPTKFCEGSCSNTGSTVNMSMSGMSVTMKMAQRGCVGIEAEEKCVKLTQEDPAVTQLFPTDSLKALGLGDFGIDMEYCTCNGNQCNSRERSRFNSGSNASVWSASFLILSVTAAMLL